MKFNTIFPLFLAVCLLSIGSLVFAQDGPAEPGGEAAAPESAAEEQLEWSDYSIKAYTLTFWGGNASGATYLENKPVGEKTVFARGVSDIIGYDGEVLIQSRDPRYDGATKKFTSGDSFGGRIGVYIASDFHIDLVASYASGKAVTSMIFTDPEVPGTSERQIIDTDDGFKSVKGGLALMYNASPANIYGVTPRLGFGLGGVINRFSELSDKTALYLEGNFGLTYNVIDNLELGLQYDLTTFGFEVDELGYSNIISYSTYSVAVSWFFDRVPEAVRAAHLAEKK